MGHPVVIEPNSATGSPDERARHSGMGYGLDAQPGRAVLAPQPAIQGSRYAIRYQRTSPR